PLCLSVAVLLPSCGCFWFDAVPSRPRRSSAGDAELSRGPMGRPYLERPRSGSSARTRPMASLTRGRSTVAEDEKSNRAVLVGDAETDVRNFTQPNLAWRSY